MIAGLTVWAVLVPESLAYATIASVPPVIGVDDQHHPEYADLVGPTVA